MSRKHKNEISLLLNTILLHELELVNEFDFKIDDKFIYMVKNDIIYSFDYSNKEEREEFIKFIMNRNK